MKSKRYTALLIGYDENLSLSTAKLLSISGFETVLLTHKKNNHAGLSKYIVETFEYSHYEELIDVIKLISQKINIDLIMPFDEEETLLVKENHAYLSTIATVAQSTEASTYKKVINKRDLWQLLTLEGLEVTPKTLNITENTQRKDIERIGFPLLLKPIRSSFGRGIFLVQNTGELTSIMNQNDLDEKYIAQEFIEGIDISCAIYANNGQIVEYVIYEHTKKNIGEFASNDSFTYQENPEVHSLMQEVIAILKWSGPVCFDLRRETKSGRLYVIEANGRYWANTLSAYTIGNINFPKLAAQDALGLPIQTNKRKTGTHYGLKELKRELKRLNFKALIRTKYFSYFDDFLPKTLRVLKLPMLTRFLISITNKYTKIDDAYRRKYHLKTHHSKTIKSKSK